MSDPLALLPFAIAAGGGRLNGIAAPALVAAGVTLLQRSAPLVRALGGRRSGIMLPMGPAFLTALAASDGHEALMLDPSASPREIGDQLGQYDVGAVFTVPALAPMCPMSIPCVLLDDSPKTAQLRCDEVFRTIDLGAHHGLLLEGSPEVEGLPEVCLITCDRAGRLAPGLTHRQLLSSLREATRQFGISAGDRLFIALPPSEWHRALVMTGATLRAGGTVHAVASPFDATTHDLGALRDATRIVADASTYMALTHAIASSSPQRERATLRHALVVGPLPDLPSRVHIEHVLGGVLTPVTGERLT